MSQWTNKYNKRRFKLPENKKIRKQHGIELQKSRINIQRWIDSIPSTNMEVKDNKGIVSSPPLGSSESASFCDIEQSNILPQRLRSAIKTKSRKAADYFNANIKQEDYEISFPTLSSANSVSHSNAVRLLASQFDRESVNATGFNHVGRLNDKHDRSPLSFNTFLPSGLSAEKKLSKYRWQPAINTSTPKQTEVLSSSISTTASRCMSVQTVTPKTYKTANMSLTNPQIEVTNQPQGNSTTQKDSTTKTTISLTKDLNADSMSFAKVVEILQQMEAKIIANETQVSKITEIGRKVDIHKQKISLQSEKIANAETDHDRVMIMADIIVKQDQKINELSDKLLAIQSRSMKHNIVLSGVSETESENCEEVSKTFF